MNYVSMQFDVTGAESNINKEIYYRYYYVNMLLMHIYRRLWVDIYRVDDNDDDDDDDVWSRRRILQSYGMIYIHDHSY